MLDPRHNKNRKVTNRLPHLRMADQVRLRKMEGHHVKFHVMEELPPIPQHQSLQRKGQTDEMLRGKSFWRAEDLAFGASKRGQGAQSGRTNQSPKRIKESLSLSLDKVCSWREAQSHIQRWKADSLNSECSSKLQGLKHGDTKQRRLSELSPLESDSDEEPRGMRLPGCHSRRRNSEIPLGQLQDKLSELKVAAAQDDLALSPKKPSAAASLYALMVAPRKFHQMSTRKQRVSAFSQPSFFSDSSQGFCR